MIKNAIAEFHKKTCIRMREREKEDTDFVFITVSYTEPVLSADRVKLQLEILNVHLYCIYRESMLMDVHLMWEGKVGNKF